ncbi:HNH endonuclease [Paracoccus sp. MC1854]|uniref:HNH endonuclease n=1 Tax=Paracoccus sp. MC1854 TaxID=2760306 RepID=UPI001601A918|nr:HNH endonuclease [Paracoccus sp. MC1854]
MKALKKIRRMKMMAQGGRCYYCGLPMWDDGIAPVAQAHSRSGLLPRMLRCTAEHLQPRSEGGANTAENIVAACLYCNNSRHRKKHPLSPAAHRAHVRHRMASGRWLATQIGISIQEAR